MFYAVTIALIFLVLILALVGWGFWYVASFLSQVTRAIDESHERFMEPTKIAVYKVMWGALRTEMIWNDQEEIDVWLAAGWYECESTAWNSYNLSSID